MSHGILNINSFYLINIINVSLRTGAWPLVILLNCPPGKAS